MLFFFIHTISNIANYISELIASVHLSYKGEFDRCRIDQQVTDVIKCCAKCVACKCKTAFLV